MNYTSQGQTNGEGHAATDEASIQSIARTAGVSEGTTDGKSGTIELPHPQSKSTCTKTFTFETAQDPLYISGYESGYQSVCSKTFDTAYKSAYATSYGTTITTRKAVIAKEAADKKSNENAIWTWVILGGVGLWVTRAIAQSPKSK